MPCGSTTGGSWRPTARGSSGSRATMSRCPATPTKCCDCRRIRARRRRAAPPRAALSPQVRTQVQVRPYDNLDNGLWAFSVAAVDLAGNVGKPALAYLRLNKYIPVTLITSVDWDKDEMGRVTLRSGAAALPTTAGSPGCSWTGTAANPSTMPLSLRPLRWQGTASSKGSPFHDTTKAPIASGSCIRSGE